MGITRNFDIEAPDMHVDVNFLSGPGAFTVQIRRWPDGSVDVDVVAASDAAIRGSLVVAPPDDEEGPWAFEVWDESGHAETLEADSAEEAAQGYVDGGDWPETRATRWHDVWTQRAGEAVERHIIEVSPTPPECSDGSLRHDWQASEPIRNGGGVVLWEKCATCGATSRTNTWAMRLDTGEQGLFEIRYFPPTA